MRRLDILIFFFKFPQKVSAVVYVPYKVAIKRIFENAKRGLLRMRRLACEQNAKRGLLSMRRECGERTFENAAPGTRHVKMSTSDTIRKP